MSLTELNEVFMDDDYIGKTDINQDSPLYHVIGNSYTIQNMTKGERIKKRLEKLKKTAYWLASEMDVKPASVYDWLDNKGPSPRRIPRLAGVLKCRKEWLEFESGPEENEKENSNEFPSHEYAFIPKYQDIRGAAGGGHHNGEHVEVSKKLAYRRDWLQSKGLRPEDLCVIEVTGESMSPHLENGDSLLIDVTRKSIQSGEIYAFQSPDGTRIKRLFLLVDGRLLLSSDNPDKKRFPDEYLLGEDIEGLKIIGKKVWRGG